MTSGKTLSGFDPRTGLAVEDAVQESSPAELDDVLASASVASLDWAARPAAERATILDHVAAALDAAADELVAIADRETALGATRLRGEVGRTSGQLRMFGDVLRDGGYVDAVISPARADVGQPDIRRMLEPIGPVAVFAASNFPFAFSVAGGDTASALAAGCAVVVKAHEAHPATSALTAAIVTAALQSAGAPPELFAVVYGRDVGTALVQHGAIKAVGFTGSQRGGRALFDLATRRPDPIPFYGELGSSNPVVILPGAAADDPDGLAKAYIGSLTMGTGQFCTNPGLLLVPEDRALLAAIAQAAESAPAGPMLTSGMRDAYDSAAQRLSTTGDVSVLGAGQGGHTDGWDVIPRVFQTDTEAFVPHTELQDEVFGPAGLVVTYGSQEQLKTAVKALGGSLAAAVHAAPRELPLAGELLGLLRQRAGRVIFNGWPTGVAVVWAMHHGGPWPATTAPRDTSVGARAIGRWLAPVAYQGWPDELLPPELRDDNPLRIPRTTQPTTAG